MNFIAVCINADDRPDGIPDSKWLKLGVVYTVIEVMKMRMQGGVLGFKLEEIDIADCFPYQYFAARRFAVLVKNQSWVEAELDRLLEEAKKEASTEPIAG